MNPLDALKQKLQVKPKVEKREMVAVVVKGEIKPSKTKMPKKKAERAENPDELVEFVPAVQETSEEIADIVKEPVTKGPIIIDQTEKGYDRMSLIQKLKESKQSKVTIKPIMEEVEESKIAEPIIFKPKRVKKIKLPLIIEEGEGEEKPKKPKLIIEDEGEEELEKPKVDIEEELIDVEAPKIEKRKTKKIEKGVAVLGSEVIVRIGDADIKTRIPKKIPSIILKPPGFTYYMNNREVFINFINSVFEKYREEIQENKENISCDDIGNTSSDFSLLTHQKIVRDYINLYTPYRGLLLYHGLGSGKTCTSIAIAEGMKNSKRIIIMTPASLRANYIEELKKCGDLLYKKNQFWEWISIDLNPEAANPISAILNLPLEYINRHRGAWFININKKSNYNDLSDNEKKTLDDQLNEMIKNKYTFINYNGLRAKRLSELTSNYTRNIFDDSVVIIDEAHNLISRIVNKIKKEKPIPENKKGEKEHLPLSLSIKLYEFLLSAKNAKVVLLTGTPVINYPNEFGILFNILRGYIKTWKLTLDIKTKEKIDTNSLRERLLGVKSIDYLDYSPSSKILTITRNPFGFSNKIKVETGYQGVNNTKKEPDGNIVLDNEFATDDEFQNKIISVLKRSDIHIASDGIDIKNQKALPDTFDLFEGQYIDPITKKLKNVDALKRRIIGLSSYFRSAQENLLPRYNKDIGVDYHIVRIPMSNFQFNTYEKARHEERKTEGKKNTKKDTVGDLYQDSTSTYRIFSRLYCNFVMPDRPIPLKKSEKGGVEERSFNKEGMTEKEIEDLIKSKKYGELVEGDDPNMLTFRKIKLAAVTPSLGLKGKKATAAAEDEDEEEEEGGISSLLKLARKEEAKQDVVDDQEGEVEGDQILEMIGGIDYKERLDRALKYIEEHSNEFLTPEALLTYSPKFLNILENIKDPDYEGLHLVYSQFRTMEGIGILSLVLEKNGFTRFKIKKSSSGIWSIDIDETNKGKPTFALYTGTETSEEKEMLRHIYNGEWDQIPESISMELRQISNNNNMGQIIKVFMITSSGSEGINLRNTRYVHIVEPYWHPVRLEQVIGRARRICSHKALPLALQTVEVFVYLMTFTPEQLKSDDAIELKRKDLSKSVPHVPMTSDQYLFEISEIKANLTAQLTDAIKETSFDCYIYSNGKCFNFTDPSKDKFAYVPDYSKQQSDTIVQANKEAFEWTGIPIKINQTEYVARKINQSLYYIYDKQSYENALKDPSIVPLQKGTLEKNENNEDVLKLFT